MSTSRVTALAASFVCSVDSTRCPVRDACTAICAVSRSRISPISTTFGSWRRIERSADANVSPAFSCTCTCTMPCIRYSTGSSTVTMLTPSLLIWLMQEYRVVVLPQPVGDVERRHDLDARDQRQPRLARNLHHLAQHSVDAIAHRHPALFRLDVDVARAREDPLRDDQIDQPDHRALARLGLGRGDRD